METIRTRKLKRSTAKKQLYLKAYADRIAKHDRSVPTYAKWARASQTERSLMKAGVGQKGLRRLKGKFGD